MTLHFKKCSYLKLNNIVDKVSWYRLVVNHVNYHFLQIKQGE